MRWVVIVSAMPLLVFGIFNVIAPRITTRWQIASTHRARSGSVRKRTGELFGRWFGASSALDAGTDPSVHRRVRVLGLAEILVSAAIVVLVLR